MLSEILRSKSHRDAIFRSVNLPVHFRSPPTRPFCRQPALTATPRRAAGISSILWVIPPRPSPPKSPPPHKIFPIYPLSTPPHPVFPPNHHPPRRLLPRPPT